MESIQKFRRQFAVNTLENVLSTINNSIGLKPNVIYKFHGRGIHMELQTYFPPTYMKFSLVVYKHPDPNIEPFGHEVIIYPPQMRAMLN